MLDEFYSIAFRKKLCAEIDELQADLDQWISSSNQERPYQGQSCLGRFRSCTSPAPAPARSLARSSPQRAAPPLIPAPSTYRNAPAATGASGFVSPQEGQYCCRRVTVVWVNEHSHV